MDIEKLKAKEAQLLKERDLLLNLRENVSLPSKQSLGDKLKKDFNDFYSNLDFAVEDSTNNKLFFQGKLYSVEMRDVYKNVEFNIFFKKNNTDFIPSMYSQHIVIESSKETRLEMKYRGFMGENDIFYLGNEKGDTIKAIEVLITELENDISLLKTKNKKEEKLIYAISDKPGFTSDRFFEDSEELLKSLNNKYIAQIKL